MKRVYDEVEPSDGRRVLVDRLWPRGVSKGAAALHAWERDAAPSNELRRWYGHDPEHFGEFNERYRAELADPTAAAALARLREYADGHDLTLLTATRQLTYAHTAVLAAILGE